MSDQIVPIWSPDAYHEVFERAATVKAVEAAEAHADVLFGWGQA